MISDIRNPWIRRALVIVVAVPFAAFMLLIDILASFEDTIRTLARAWRGRAPYYRYVPRR